MSEEHFTWKIEDPARVGMDPERLTRLRDDLAARQTSGLLIVRNDAIVCEWYSPDSGVNVRHYTASLAKGLVGGMALLTAINDGYIGLDDPAYNYIPAWRHDPVKAKITIRHLVTHTSGIEDAEEAGKSHNELDGWKGAFWRRDPDPFSIAVYQAPAIHEPGTTFAYSNPGYAALAYALTASLAGSPYSDLQVFLRDRIMRPIGVTDEEWAVGYGRKYVVDGLPLVATWGGADYTARAAARVGRLMLRLGDWEGVPLLKPEIARMAVSDAGQPITGPGRTDVTKLSVQALGWANNANGSRAPLPRDAFFSDGAGHQFLMVVPSLNLIVVRHGNNLDQVGFSSIQKHLINPIMEAIVA